MDGVFVPVRLTSAVTDGVKVMRAVLERLDVGLTVLEGDTERLAATDALTVTETVTEARTDCERVMLKVTLGETEREIEPLLVELELAEIVDVVDRLTLPDIDRVPDCVADAVKERVM